MDLAERFWMKVNKTDGCWLWTASCDQHGYGQFRISGRKGPAKAHRVAWFLTFGVWPVDQLLHACDNPPCVRPGVGHTFEGSQTDNMQDASTKRRLRGVFGPDRPPQPVPRKLTETAVHEIRLSLDHPKALAVRYDVHVMTIYRVRRRALWTRVE